MRCPYCAHPEDSVLDSRPIDSASVIRRRRECVKCSKRFTTYERLEEMPLMVVKSDDRREPFSRDKLRHGIVRACEKRPVSIDTIDQIVSEVEYSLKDYVMEIPTRIIGERILAKLLEADEVAYVRFASVYRNFSDLDSFVEAVRKLKQKSRKKKVNERRKIVKAALAGIAKAAH